MGQKRLRQSVTFLLTFVPVLIALGGLLGLAALFVPETFSGLSPVEKGSSLLIVVIVAALIAWLGPRFVQAIGLDARERTDASALYDFSSSGHRANRENVIATVRAGYITGVLRPAMPEQVRLNLGLEISPDALLRPPIRWEGQTIVPDAVTSDDIYRLFRDSGRALLILGAPGSGKTITLLELCERLLDDATADPDAPIPVVINLSTWAEAQKPLAEWLVDEMLRQYGLARPVTPAWLAAGQLALLLDGLDEVRADVRDNCVVAINDFRAGHSGPLVVCSRAVDYESLRTHLNLTQAVMIQPLDDVQVATYLADPRLQLAAVAEAVAEDDALRELSTTPLMLNIMAVAYQGASQDALLPFMRDSARWRTHLYDAYIRRVLARRPLLEKGYSPGPALRHLRYLAEQMIRRSETQFFIEDLQFDWLTPKQRRVARVVLFMIGSALFSTLFVLVGSTVGGILFSVPIRIIGGVLTGIGGGILIGRTSTLEMVDKLNVIITWRSLTKIVIKNILYGTLYAILAAIFFGTLFGLVFGVVFWAMGLILASYLAGEANLLPLSPEEIRSAGLGLGILGGLIVGLAFGVLFGVLFAGMGTGLRVGLGDMVQPAESRRWLKQNQGIHQSARNAIQGSVVGAILYGIIYGSVPNILLKITMGWLFSIPPLLVFRFGFLFGGLGGGLGGGVRYGGGVVIRHYVLRLLLARYGYLPGRLVPFLEAMAAHDLIRSGGAHYRFIHRTFQEHVAALTDETIAALAE